jgi:DNA invertase Pin-like site-specific DNA recombinase
MIAAYVRVSSKQQDLGSQKDAIERAAAARGDSIARWYEEKRSAKTMARPELKALRAAVRRGELRAVYIFRIDRISRSGARDFLALVDEFERHDCKLHSIADALDLEGPMRDVVFAVLAMVAQMEWDAIGDRISAARERVEAQGGRWGRPRRIDPGTLDAARLLRAEGVPLREMAQRLHVPRSTLQGALAEKGHYKPRPDPAA